MVYVFFFLWCNSSHNIFTFSTFGCHLMSAIEIVTKQNIKIQKMIWKREWKADTILPISFSGFLHVEVFPKITITLSVATLSDSMRIITFFCHILLSDIGGVANWVQALGKDDISNLWRALHKASFKSNKCKLI